MSALVSVFGFDRGLANGLIRVPVPGFVARQTAMQRSPSKRKQVTRDEMMSLFARELSDLKNSVRKLRS